MQAMERACQMIQELDAGDVVDGVIDLYPSPLPVQRVSASCDRIAKRAGVPMQPEEIEDILRRLRFDVTRHGDALDVVVPDDRQDVSMEADLCEEALRIYGYDKIPGTLLRGETTPGGRSAKMQMRMRISDLLTGLGFDEIMKFSFVSPRSVEKLNLPESDPRLHMLAIRNPLGEDTSVMRTMLVPDMLSTLALNMNHGNADAKLFELSRVFDPDHKTDEGLPTETQHLCLGMYGKNTDFYALRGIVERLLGQLGIETVVERYTEPYLHPGRSAVLKADGQIVCVLGEVHPDVREAFDMPSRALVADLDVDLLMQLQQPMGEVRPMPRYPAVNRDLSLVMPESTEVGPLMRAMSDAAGNLLEDAKMFDVYRSPLLGLNMKSIAFSFIFRGADHTLTDAEISGAMEKILKAAQAYQAVIRS